MTGWDGQITDLKALKALKAEFPGWHVWRSNAGRWWATRTGAVLRRADLSAGRVMTLNADDIESLRNDLLAQTSIDQDVIGLTGSKEPIRYGLSVR
jgi:hypothetical protein